MNMEKANEEAVEKLLETHSGRNSLRISEVKELMQRAFRAGANYSSARALRILKNDE